VSSALPSLSVVLPVYNEPYWVVRTVADVVETMTASPFEDVEVVIVDDGSEEATRIVLAQLETPFPLRVLRQANAGRFRARAAGIEAARGELVLLLDSRVSLERDALPFIGRTLLETPSARVWNGHVEPEPVNLFARFWRVPPAIFWRRYLSNPRTTSFGLDEFDWFPKGTGCFLAPRRLFLEALEEFSTLYEDARHANDDTLLLRSIASRERIHISPGFAGVYRARTSWLSFLRHAFHRGTVFFDAFARPGTRFFPFLAAFFPLSAACAVQTLRRPRAALALGASVPALAAAAALGVRRPLREVVAFATLAPVFTVAYAAGIWRGGALAARARVRRRREAAEPQR
jgi:hypothetical protein